VTHTLAQIPLNLSPVAAHRFNQPVKVGLAGRFNLWKWWNLEPRHETAAEPSNRFPPIQIRELHRESMPLLQAQLSAEEVGVSAALPKEDV
jgi:hypothetical protein